MRGEVLSYDSTAGTGLISGDDGARYAFTAADTQPGAVLHAGQPVDFVIADGFARQVLAAAGAVVLAAAQLVVAALAMEHKLA